MFSSHGAEERPDIRLFTSTVIAAREAGYSNPAAVTIGEAVLGPLPEQQRTPQQAVAIFQEALAAGYNHEVAAMIAAARMGLGLKFSQAT